MELKDWLAQRVPEISEQLRKEALEKGLIEVGQKLDAKSA